jgi:hypothetical protein
MRIIGKSKQLQEITWATIKSKLGLLAKEAEANTPNEHIFSANKFFSI